MPPTRTTEPSRAKIRDRVRSRASILLAAREVFESEGLQGARIGEIAKRAGVPQGLLYHYFAGKEEIFRAVLDEALEPYFLSTIEMLEQGDGADLGLLERAIRLHFEFLRRHPHVARLMAWWQADQGWKHGPPLPDEKAELCQRPFVLGVQRIREGQDRGWIRAELDPLLVIDSFLTLSMDWHVNLGAHLAERGISPDDNAAVDALHDRALEHIVELVLHGVTTDAARAKKADGGASR